MCVKEIFCQVEIEVSELTVPVFDFRENPLSNKNETKPGFGLI